MLHIATDQLFFFSLCFATYWFFVIERNELKPFCRQWIFATKMTTNESKVRRKRRYKNKRYNQKRQISHNTHFLGLHPYQWTWVSSTVGKIWNIDTVYYSIRTTSGWIERNFYFFKKSIKRYFLFSNVVFPSRWVILVVFQKKYARLRK